MQPVFPYRAESYPPRGGVWPQFGDDIVEDTVSISEGARQSLARKREVMSEFHNENLRHYGMAPREDRQPPLQDPSPAEGLEMRTNEEFLARKASWSRVLRGRRLAVHHS